MNSSFMSLLAGCGLAFAACASTATTSGGGAAQAVATATYSAVTDVGNDEDGPADATDCLTIRAAQDGALDYDFVFHFPYDHACSMQGSALPTGPGEWEDESQADCRLRLTWERDSWTVFDVDGNCQNENCGARGFIGHSFEAKTAATARKCQ